MSEGSEPLPEEVAPEDRARADFYALLARLYADAPDAALLGAIAGAMPLVPEAAAAEGEDGSLAGAWDALRAASAVAEPSAVADEHQALFVGVGRSAVSPHASYYIAPQSGRLLAELRSALAQLGLARLPNASQYEDHLASLLETMRFLAAGDHERPPASIAEQHAFFERYIASWAFECCAAIMTCTLANYYREVAEFTRRFLALERDSFAVE